MAKYKKKPGLGGKQWVSLGVTLFILFSTFLLVPLVKKFQSIRGKAAPADANLILKLVKDPATGETSVEEAVANDGYSPAYVEIPDVQYSDVLEEMDESSRVIAEYKFNFMEELVVETADAEGNLKGERVKLDKPEAYLSIPFRKSSRLAVKGRKELKGADKVYTALLNKKAVDKNPKVLVKYGSEFGGEEKKDEKVLGYGTYDGYLDILYIADKYSDFNLFHQDAKAMANYLFTLFPFNEYKSHTRVVMLDNTVDLKCVFGSGLLACDGNLVKQVASQVNYDTIIVVHNTNQYGGAGYTGQNIAVTYRDVSSWARQVAAHELGHSFASLMDEYNYGVNGSPYGVNCSYSPCKWAGTPGTGCFSVCGYSNLYRPTENGSIMRSLYAKRYGPVSEEALGKIVRGYIPELLFNGSFSVADPVSVAKNPGTGWGRGSENWGDHFSGVNTTDSTKYTFQRLFMFSGADVNRDAPWLRYEQGVYLTGGRSYTAEARAAVFLKVGRGVSMAVQDQANNIVSGSAIEWSQNSTPALPNLEVKYGTFVAPATGWYSARLFAEDGSQVVFDNIKVRDNLTGQNLVIYGDFRSSDSISLTRYPANGWGRGSGNWGDYFAGVNPIYSTVFTYQKLFMYSPVNHSNEANPAWLRYEQGVYLTTGKRYTLKARAAVFWKVGRGVSAAVQDGANNVVSGAWIDWSQNSTPTAPNLEQKTVNFSVSTSGWYSVRLFVEDGSQAVWDDVSLVGY